jgi:hypothetical protein
VPAQELWKHLGTDRELKKAVERGGIREELIGLLPH